MAVAPSSPMGGYPFFPPIPPLIPISRIEELGDILGNHEERIAALEAGPVDLMAHFLANGATFGPRWDLEAMDPEYQWNNGTAPPPETLVAYASTLTIPAGYVFSEDHPVPEAVRVLDATLAGGGTPRFEQPVQAFFAPAFTFPFDPAESGFIGSDTDYYAWWRDFLAVEFSPLWLGVSPVGMDYLWNNPPLTSEIATAVGERGGGGVVGERFYVSDGWGGPYADLEQIGFLLSLNDGQGTAVYPVPPGEEPNGFAYEQVSGGYEPVLASVYPEVLLVEDNVTELDGGGTVGEFRLTMFRDEYWIITI